MRVRTQLYYRKNLSLSLVKLTGTIRPSTHTKFPPNLEIPHPAR